MPKPKSRQRKYIPQKDLALWREENKPERCPILGHANFIPVVDHDHQTGKIRGVVSSEGNALLGKIENFFNTRCVNAEWDLIHVLTCISKYLCREQYIQPFHPVGIRQLTKRFSRQSKNWQEGCLESFGYNEDEINACKNSKERTKLYRKKLIGD